MRTAYVISCSLFSPRQTIKASRPIGKRLEAQPRFPVIDPSLSESLQITVTDSHPVLNSDLSLWMILIHMIEESMKILYRSVQSSR
jgi:hypothetical protein